ncbi:MAG: zeta toxin family protein [Streptosporangiales bacterium]
MIWTAERNMDQGALVASTYECAASVPCERRAIMLGGLRGADTAGALAQAGIDASRYLTISIDGILVRMAGRGLIPHVDGLTPLEVADLVHVEAQFLAKRLGLRALADGRNVIWDISMASQRAVESWMAAQRRAGYAIHGIFVELSIEESVRRSEALHRRGHDEYCRGRGFGGRFVPAGAIRALALTAASSPGGTQDAEAVSSLRVGITPGEPIPAGEVTAMIRSYLSGALTLDVLCQQFRSRRWPAVPPACPAGMGKAAPAIDDPEPYIPGSSDDVVRAYDLGWITDPDYEALAGAIVP